MDRYKNKTRRIYFIEFLRLFLILAIFLMHLGQVIDPELGDKMRLLCQTKAYKVGFGVEIFFLIGGFFLYQNLARTSKFRLSTAVGKLWLRLMPGLIFCYLILVLLGARKWCLFPFVFIPSSGWGICGELVGFGDWYVGVYFFTSCLFISLFSTSHKSAWIWVSVLLFTCLCMQKNVKPVKGMYYGFLTHQMVRGLSCMALGIIASHLAGICGNVRKNIFLRSGATIYEVLTLFMIVSYMYRTTEVPYDPIALEFAAALLLISVYHSWGAVSALLNRISWIMYISRYTYSILLVQGMLIYYFKFNHNFGMTPSTCVWIIFLVAIPCIMIEYHLIEKRVSPYLVNKLKRLPENLSCQEEAQPRRA